MIAGAMKQVGVANTCHAMLATGQGRRQGLSQASCEEVWDVLVSSKNLHPKPTKPYTLNLDLKPYTVVFPGG